MNTFLGPEQQSLLASYQSYIAETVAPHSGDLESGRATASEHLKKFGERGFLGLAVPSEYGGQGASFLDLVLFCEALAASDAGLALSVASHAAASDLLVLFGTDKQKSRYLPLLARGEMIATFATSEETAGSDFSAVAARVSLAGGKPQLSGAKTWVVNGDFAGLALVLARCQERLSIWLVDLTEKSGVDVGPARAKLGLRSASTCDLTFQAKELEEDAFLGDARPADAIDDSIAVKQVRAGQDVGKVIVAAAAVGMTAAGLSASVVRAKEREQFGAPIAKQQAIQWKLADMSADSSAARLLTYRAAWARDCSDADFGRYAAMCKLFAARTARVHSAEAVQIFGAMGIEEGSETEKLYRDAKVMEICEGTSETQKNIIADELGV